MNQEVNQNKSEENQAEKEKKVIEQNDMISLDEKNKTKRAYIDGILTLIGSQIHSMGFGSLYALLNLHTYLISYLRYHQKGEKTLTLQYIYFIGLVMSIIRGFFTPFVSIFETKLGLIKAIILGAIINIGGTAVIYVSKNYFVDLLGFFMISLGQSLTALRRRNVMSYFYHVRGKLSGIISVLNAFITAGYNVICEKWIMNPESENPTVDKDYYGINVASNYLKYIQFIWCCTGFGTLISLLLIIPFQEEKHGKGLFAPKGKEEKNIKEDKKALDDDNNNKTEPLLPEFNENENDEVKHQPKNEGTKEENKEENEDKKEEKEEKIENDEEKKKEEKEEKEEEKNKNEEKEEKKENDEEKKQVENEEKKEEKKEEKNKNEDKEEKNEKEISKRTISAPDINALNKDEEILKIDDDSTRKRNPTLVGVKHKKLNDNPETRPRKKTIHNRFDIKVIKKALKSRRILRLFLMGIFSAPLGNFLGNMWRNIAIRKQIDTLYLQNIGTYSPFVMFTSAFIFSWLSDYIPFRYLASILSLCISVNGILFCFSFNNPIFLTIVLLSNTFFGMGVGSVFEPHFIKVFGLKHYIEIGGVISLPGVIMGPICTVFIFIFENIFADSINAQDGSDLPYFFLFIISSLLRLVSSILCFFEPEEEIISE